MTTARINCYQFDPPPGWEHDAITVQHTGKLAGGRFHWNADVWAIRRGGYVLNRDGQWEHEPLPSSRDDAFLARCRYPLADALRHAAREAARHYATLTSR